MNSKTQMEIFKDIDAVSLAGANEFVRLCADAIAARGRATVALSGGNTPKEMFTLLATDAFKERVDWQKLHLFWSDERYIDVNDDDSNEGMARAALISHVDVPADQVHGMYRPGGVQAAAADYEQLVREELGDDLSFDLTLLGIGLDGHTASLFPGEPAVHEETKLVVAGIGHAGVSERITMTPTLINKSKTVMFLVVGKDKAKPMKRVLEGPEDWDRTPSQAIARHAPNVVWLLDEAAASDLQP